MKRFCQYPDCKDFTLSSKEEVQLVIRKHWMNDYIILAQWIFWGPLFFFITIFLFAYFDISFSSNVGLLVFSGKILYLLFVTFWYFIKWTNETFDVIFLTNDRVLDVTQEDFWHRSIIETRLDHVQDATGDIKGFINTMFDWGSIKIRTANDIADFSINMIQNAHKKAREVFRLANVARKKEILGGEIKIGEFCPVDFSDHKKNKNTADISREISHTLPDNREVSQVQKIGGIKTTITYPDIKKTLRSGINKIMSQKK